MTGEFFIRLEDPDKTIRTGAVFLNVVECTGSDPLKKCTSVVHKDFRSVFDESVSSIKPEFYSKVYTGDILRTGFSVSFASKVNPSVIPGYYVLVIQIYDCQNTNPNTVGTDPQCHRIDQPRGYWMDISTSP